MDALFAGEASGHYYFRDNFYADNGMIPFLLVLENLCAKRHSLSEWVARLRAEYPVSGEINFAFESHSLMRDAMNAVQHTLHRWGTPSIEAPIDGLSVRFLTSSQKHTIDPFGRDNWRFNLRESNTGPLLRLNVETRGNENLLIEKTEILSNALETLGGRRETKFRWETASP